MKAISVKQPVCELIRLGIKPIETRVWGTDYRGPLLICASKVFFDGILIIEGRTILPKSFERIISDTNLKYTLGTAICVVDLVDIKPMSKEHETLACCPIYPKAKSWFLENVREIKPFNVSGKLSLFEVDDNLIQFNPF